MRVKNKDLIFKNGMQGVDYALVIQDSTANVGIGKLPGDDEKLHVAGNTRITGDMILNNGETDSPDIKLISAGEETLWIDAYTHPGKPSTLRMGHGTQADAFLDENGNFYIRGVLTQAQVMDLCENIPVSETDIEPGDVVIADSESSYKVKKCIQEYDTKVIGIITDGKGSLLNTKGEGKPVCLVGVIPCNVDADYGEIKPGDLLVTSKTAGYARKADLSLLKEGMLVGKALESLKWGKGEIKVFVK